MLGKYSCTFCSMLYRCWNSYIRFELLPATLEPFHVKFSYSCLIETAQVECLINHEIVCKCIGNLRASGEHDIEGA